MEYKQIDLMKNTNNIPLNSHIRYFNITDDNQKQFRLGGYLKKVDLDKRYCVLTNNKQSWCVKISFTIYLIMFFNLNINY